MFHVLYGLGNHTSSMLLREGRSTHAFIELILSWKHSGFNVDASTRFHSSDRKTAERLARYISKPAIALERLAYDDEAGIVSYRTKNGVISMEPVDFIGRLKPHIPDTYERGAVLLYFSTHYITNKSRTNRIARITSIKSCVVLRTRVEFFLRKTETRETVESRDDVQEFLKK